MRKKQFEDQLAHVINSIRSAYEERMTDFEVVARQSLIDVTEYCDPSQKLAPGPTLVFTITMHDPREERPDIWESGATNVRV